MGQKNAEPKREMRKIVDLKPYPLQEQFYDPLPDRELQALAAKACLDRLHSV